jgi:hypothetical protein
MGNLALTTAGVLHVVESLEQMTLPLAESINVGQVVRIDTTYGTFTKSNASSAAEALAYGILVSKDAAGKVGTAVRRGVLDGYALSGLNFAAKVYLSDTDGTLATTAGSQTLVVGDVIAGTATTLGTAYDKLLHLDFGLIGSVTNTAPITIRTDLLAASVDTWMFVADRAYEVTYIGEVHSVVGSTSAAVQPRKVTAVATDAPGAAAGSTVKELTTAAIDLTATINVVQAPALTATAADLLLAAGDKIGLNFTGTLTGLVGTLTIILEPR